MIITAIFKNEGTPVTGLTPTIDIFDVTNGLQVVTGATMAEVGGGIYKYDFTAYDPALDYATVCDGGASLNVVDRYATAGAGTAGDVQLILEDTNEMQGDLADGGRLDFLVDGIKARTDLLPDDPADQFLVETAIATAESNIRGGTETIGTVKATADGIKIQTDLLPADPASETNVTTAVANSENNIRGVDGDSLKILSDQLDANLTAAQSIQNNTTTRIDVPERIVRPNADSKIYRIIVGLYDTNGNPQTPDSTPTIQIESISGVERLAETSFTQFTGQPGQYYYDLPVAATDPLEVIVFRVKIVEDGITTYHRRSSEVTQFEADLNEVQAHVTAIKQKTDYMPTDTAAELTTIQNGVSGVQTILEDGVNGLAAIKTGVDAVDTNTAMITSLLQNATYGLDALRALLDAIDTSAESAGRFDEIKGAGWTNETLAQLDGLLDAIKAKTDFLPDDTMAEFDAIDAAVADLDADLIQHDTNAVNGNAAIQTLLEDATYGLAALRALLEIINADTTTGISSMLDEIKGVEWTGETLVQLDSLLYGIKAMTDHLPVDTAQELIDIDAAIADLDADVAQLSVDTSTENTAIQALLEDATHGLAALRTLLNTIDASTTTGIDARFDEIKGAGWTSETLVQLDSLLDTIKQKTDYMPADITQEFTDINTEIAGVRERTNRLPDDPASQSVNQAALDAAESRVDHDLSILLLSNENQNARLDEAKTSIDEYTSAVNNYTVKLYEIKTQLDTVETQTSDANVLQAISDAQADLETLINALQSDITFIRDIEGGRWRIEGPQMIFYKEDNITEVARFNLFDDNGIGSATNVHERQRL